MLYEILEERQQTVSSGTSWRMLEDSLVSTCTAGGKMYLLMDPSFLQHLQEPKPAEGIKYGIITAIIL